MLKIDLRLDVGKMALRVPASQIQCNGQFTTLSRKRYHSLIPTLAAIGLITRPIGLWYPRRESTVHTWPGGGPRCSGLVLSARVPQSKSEAVQS